MTAGNLDGHWSETGEAIAAPPGLCQSSRMPASAMTFFQISVSRAMWAAASACVLARVSMPCWPYAARTSGALSALVRIAFSVATISGGTFDDTTTAYQLVAA